MTNAQAPPHVHHWRLEPPNGPTAMGRCACGAARSFRNSFYAHSPVFNSAGPRCPGCGRHRKSKAHAVLCEGKP